MEIVNTIDEVRQLRRQNPRLSWGLVPTMGYLHAGHLTLVARARAENDKVAVTIFVNPTQFAPNEDLDSYPRDLARDQLLLRQAGVDLLFIPEKAHIYPPDFQTTVVVDKVTQPLEGSARPTHFRGVATIVTKLLNIVQPTRAYFGQKDFQQTVVVRRLVRDLNIDSEIVVCPTVREADGLALSSRNQYLNPAEREAATVLYRALTTAYNRIVQGERDADRLRRQMAAIITAEPLARLDYVSVADPQSLLELQRIEREAVLSLAVYIGKTRLIDNMQWQVAD